MHRPGLHGNWRSLLMKLSFHLNLILDYNKLSELLSSTHNVIGFIDDPMSLMGHAGRGNMVSSTHLIQ